MAVTATYYVPDSSGSALSNLGVKFRIQIDQSYDPADNRSVLTLIPQIYCANQYYPPSNVMFLYDSQSPGLVADVQVDGSTVGRIASTNSSSASGRMVGASTDLNKWVGLKLGSNAYTMTKTVAHAGDGSKTITVAIGRLWAQSVGNSSYYGTLAASSHSVPITQSRKFALSVSATGCTVSVTKGGSTVNPGANAVTYGDVLTITATASTGYNAPSLTITGATKSGNTYTVTGDVSVVATGTKKAYTLSISQGTNSTIVVKRNGSVLSDGATVYHFDQLQITMTAASGFHLTTNSVSGVTQSGSYYVVNGNVTVTTEADGNDHTLYLTQGAHTTLSVTYNGDPLSDNANISTGQTLVVSASADTGYNTPTITVTGATEGDPGEYTVGDADVRISSSTTPLAYTLTITADENSTVTVTKNGSPVASGDTIYYDDELVITAVPSPGYELSTFTVNSEPFVSGGTYTVKGAVAVVTVAEELVGAYLKLEAGWARYAAYIFGNSWNRYVPYIKLTNGWVKY